MAVLTEPLKTVLDGFDLDAFDEEGSCTGGAYPEPPLTAEPFLAEDAPLTSETPMGLEPPLTSEPSVAAGGCAAQLEI